MYDYVVKELRTGYCEPNLLRKAADAIEELSRVAEINAKRALVWAAEAEKATRWVPVTEGFPKDRVPVQVCYIGMNTGTVESDLLACRYYGTWCYWDGEPCSYDECQVEITHWKPLAQPPKEEHDG